MVAALLAVTLAATYWFHSPVAVVLIVHGFVAYAILGEPLATLMHWKRGYMHAPSNLFEWLSLAALVMVLYELL
jgi:hypothetical protein